MRDLVKISENHLGHPGKLISSSKSGYRQRNPDNLVVFNANVCTDEGKIWWGDLDVTLSKENLMSLAEEIGGTIYVLFEMDGRFENEDLPKINSALVKFLPDRSYILSEAFKNFKL
jgi:hypothetical protein